MALQNAFGNLALDATLQAVRDRLPTTLGRHDSSGSLSMVLSSDHGPVTIMETIPVSSTGTINSQWGGSGAGQVEVAVTSAYKTYLLHLSASAFTGTLQFFYSTDHTNWTPIVAQRIDTTLTSAATSVALSAATTVQDWRATIPVGATHIAVCCTAYTSGSVSATIYASAGATVNYVSTNTSLMPTTNRVGFFAHSGIGYNDTSTPVNANQTITTAAKLTYNTQTATAWNAASTYGNRFRAAAGSDVTGTLVIDFSVDATTWYPYTSISLAQIGGTGNFGAVLDVAVAGLYMRARLINGATNQARVYLTTNIMA